MIACERAELRRLPGGGVAHGKVDALLSEYLSKYGPLPSTSSSATPKPTKKGSLEPCGAPGKVVFTRRGVEQLGSSLGS